MISFQEEKEEEEDHWFFFLSSSMEYWISRDLLNIDNVNIFIGHRYLSKHSSEIIADIAKLSMILQNFIGKILNNDIISYDCRRILINKGASILYIKN